jgi:hypothetical protein
MSEESAGGSVVACAGRVTVVMAGGHHGPFQITQVISPVAYKLALPHQ